MCEFGVEPDEEIVVVQKRQGVFERDAWWQRRDVVESCGGVEC